MKRSISILLILLVLFSLSTTVLAMTDAEYKKAIEAQQTKWQEANKKGDKAAMDAAHAEANRIRASQGEDTSKSDGSGDKRMQRLKIDELKDTNKEAYEVLSKAYSEGKDVIYSYDKAGNTQYEVKATKVVETRERTVTEMSPTERQRNINQIPKTNVNGQALNEKLFIEKGIVSYGSVPNNPPSKENGEVRYYGYDANGNLYTNANFPPDADSGRKGYEKNWLSVNEIENNKNASNLIGYSGSSTQINDQLLKDAQKLLDNSPDWKNSGLTPQDIAKNFVYQQGSSEYGGGSFVGVHKGSDGKLWYQTFTVSSDPYTVKETITSTTPGIKFTIEGPKPPQTSEEKKPNTSSDPKNPKEPTTPVEPKEPKEPTTPKEPQTPKEPKEPSATPKLGTATITINYICKKHGVFDSDIVSLQVLEGKNYNVKIPAKNFQPVHKLVDAPEKSVAVSYSNPKVSVSFNYEDYHAIPKMSGIVRPHKMKSGYGFEVEANYALDTNFDPSEIKGNLQAIVEFLGQTYTLEKQPGSTNVYASFKLPYNPDSLIQARKIYTPVELKDGVYKATITIKGTNYQPNNPLSIQEVIDVEIKGHMYEDDYTKPKN